MYQFWQIHVTTLTNQIWTKFSKMRDLQTDLKGKAMIGIGFCFVPASQNLDNAPSASKFGPNFGLAKLILQSKARRGCVTFWEVWWILTRLGHINQVPTGRLSDSVTREGPHLTLKQVGWGSRLLSDKTRQWSDLGHIRPSFLRETLAFLSEKLRLHWVHVNACSDPWPNWRRTT